jgi:hypothetical protein
MKLANKAYDATKFIALVALPSFGTLYFALAQIWHLPKAEEIVGSITVVDTFLGVLLGVSTTRYNKTEGAPDGDLIVVKDEDGNSHFALGVNNSVESMTSKPTVSLNVVSQDDTDPKMQAPVVTPSGTVTPSNVPPAPSVGGPTQSSPFGRPDLPTQS